MTEYPSRLTIELTNACNLECKMCPRKYMKSKVGFMSTHGFKKVCNQAKHGHVETAILFWRGEASLHPCFGELVRYARQSFPRLELATNGKGWGHFKMANLKLIDFLSVSVHELPAIEFVKNAIVLMRRGGHIQATCVKGAETEEAVKELAGKVNRVKIYDEHTVDGVWGKCSGDANATEAQACPRLSTDLVVAWDGSMSRCTHVWETSSRANIFKMGLHKAWKRAQEIDWSDLCEKCDQNEGPTKGEVIE